MLAFPYFRFTKRIFYPKNAGIVNLPPALLEKFLTSFVKSLAFLIPRGNRRCPFALDSPLAFTVTAYRVWALSRKEKAKRPSFIPKLSTLTFVVVARKRKALPLRMRASHYSLNTQKCVPTYVTNHSNKRILSIDDASINRLF